MSDAEKTLHELLDQAGVKAGGWAGVEPHAVQPALVQRQAEALLKLRGLLETLVAQDQAALASLHEQLARLKHGGGS